MFALTLLTVLSSCASKQQLIENSVHGSKADQLADSVYWATNQECWNDSSTIAWQFGKKKELWDMKRELFMVEKKDVKVIISLASPATGKAYKKGIEVTGKQKSKLLAKAYHSWANDSYWLNPFPKFYDQGVNRSTYTDKKGNRHLIIYYKDNTGKIGDTYDWTIGKDYVPTGWQLYVKIIPIQKYGFTWEQWTTLPCGLKISQLHRSSAFSIHLTNVQIIDNWKDTEYEKDPFAAIVE